MYGNVRHKLTHCTGIERQQQFSKLRPLGSSFLFQMPLLLQMKKQTPDLLKTLEFSFNFCSVQNFKTIIGRQLPFDQHTLTFF